MRCGLNSKMSCGVSITKEMMYYCHNEHHLYRGKLVPLAARADIIVTWPSSAPLPWLAEVKWTSGLLMKLLGVEMPPSNWLLTDGPEQFYSPVPIISLLWCLSSWHSDMTLQEIVLLTLHNESYLLSFRLVGGDEWDFHLAKKVVMCNCTANRHILASQIEQT